MSNLILLCVLTSCTFFTLTFSASARGNRNNANAKLSNYGRGSGENLDGISPNQPQKHVRNRRAPTVTASPAPVIDGGDDETEGADQSTALWVEEGKSVNLPCSRDAVVKENE